MFLIYCDIDSACSEAGKIFLEIAKVTVIKGRGGGSRAEHERRKPWRERGQVLAFGRLQFSFNAGGSQERHNERAGIWPTHPSPASGDSVLGALESPGSRGLLMRAHSKRPPSAR